MIKHSAAAINFDEVHEAREIGGVRDHDGILLRRMTSCRCATTKLEPGRSSEDPEARSRR